MLKNLKIGSVEKCSFDWPGFYTPLCFFEHSDAGIAPKVKTNIAQTKAISWTIDALLCPVLPESAENKV
jgi:hypothetical protein